MAEPNNKVEFVGTLNNEHLNGEVVPYVLIRINGELWGISPIRIIRLDESLNRWPEDSEWFEIEKKALCGDRMSIIKIVDKIREYRSHAA